MFSIKQLYKNSFTFVEKKNQNFEELNESSKNKLIDQLCNRQFRAQKIIFFNLPDNNSNPNYINFEIKKFKLIPK